MNRKEITKFLGELLVRQRLSGRGKYYASEVSLDYGSVDVRRVDFMQFEPAGVTHISEIEKGIFICYEVKSCKADFESGFGRNFIGEKNYFVMPMATYKEVLHDIPHNVGVMVPIPWHREKTDEFENPTDLATEKLHWNLEVIKPANKQGRKRSMSELLFCMLRSGH